MASWRSTQKSQPERVVEKYLKDKITDLGGLAWKFTSPGTAGVPDRIIVLNGLMCFAELKRPKGGRISDMQHWRIKQLHDQGQKAYVIKNTDQVDELVSCMMQGRLPDVDI